MRRRTFLATAGAAAVSAAIAGCSEAGPGIDGTPDDDDDDFDLGEVDAEIGETPDDLEVTDSRLVETADGAAVIATVENTGDTAYEFVEVEVTLNDGDTVLGEWVDTSEEEIDGLGPGERWRFIATFDDEEVSGATGYTINVDGDLADENGGGD